MPAELDLEVRQAADNVVCSESTICDETLLCNDGLTFGSGVAADALSATGVNPSSLTLTPAP